MQREYCHVVVKGGVENSYGKVNILLQSFVSHGLVDTFSLVSDMNYVSQASPLLLRVCSPPLCLAVIHCNPSPLHCFRPQCTACVCACAVVTFMPYIVAHGPLSVAACKPKCDLSCCHGNELHNSYVYDINTQPIPSGRYVQLLSFSINFASVLYCVYSPGKCAIMYIHIQFSYTPVYLV